MLPSKMPVRGLILTENVCIGYQLSTLFRLNGYSMQVEHSDYSAYDVILQGNISLVVADIETPNLGGLAVVAYCNHNLPHIRSYGLILSDDGELERMARNSAGCRDFFHTVGDGNSLRIDTERGMGAILRSQQRKEVVSEGLLQPDASPYPAPPRTP